jgi:glycosyltransferase involved in cell wall biosynthesis
LNEAATIADVVKAAAAWGRCIVVDDGSSDATGELARAAGATVVRHDHNRGYDAALDSGFRAAHELGCDTVVTLDADGQHDPNLVGKLLDALGAGADLAVGVRDRRARWSEQIFAWYTRWRWGLRDPLCGLKAYRMPVYLRLGHFDSYRSIGTELLLFGVSHGFRVEQVNFHVRAREGRPRFGRRVHANLMILRAMFLSYRATRSSQG